MGQAPQTPVRQNTEPATVRAQAITPPCVKNNTRLRSAAFNRPIKEPTRPHIPSNDSAAGRRRMHPVGEPYFQPGIGSRHPRPHLPRPEIHFQQAGSRTASGQPQKAGQPLATAERTGVNGIERRRRQSRRNGRSPPAETSPSAAHPSVRSKRPAERQPRYAAPAPLP